jgi:predicted metal-dependent enzyme (double-stranded beta helix superfamily)
MFDLDRFFADCRDAVDADPNHRLVRDVVARAVAQPDAVMAALGEPRRAGINVLYRASNLTVLNLVWGPGMTIMPHDHRMCEDDAFWRRLPPDAGREIEAGGARSLCRGDCTPLGADIVHSVTNPIPRLTGAIHVYGGDFLTQERSEWDPETLHERPYDVAKARQLFEDSNRALAHA